MSFLLNLLSVLVVLLGIAFTIFMNYPEPPLSPLLYQWQSTGKHFKFKGHQIFYKDERTPSNITNDLVLLLIHGFPTSSYDYYKIMPDLKRNIHRIIAPDLLGYGFSDKPRHHSYSITEQADLIEDLFGKLKLKEVHILAHDYGDTVAQELLARQLEGILTFSIESTCLLNGGIFPHKHQPRLVQTLLRAPIVGTILSKLSNYYLFKWSLSEVFGDNEPEVHEYHDFWKLIRHKNGYRVSGDLLSYIEERFQHEDKWVGALRKTRTPLHFIYGPKDPVNPPPFQEFYKQIIPNPSIDVLPAHVGHYPQVEAPKQVIQLYFNWLKKIGYLKEIVFNN